MAETFTLVIGAKRQVTFPAKLLELLSLKEGDEFDISVENGQISLVPMARVPRHFVPPALLEKMEARRGAKSSDMTLDDFAAWIESSGKTAAKASPAPQSKAKAETKKGSKVGAKLRARLKAKSKVTA